MADFLSLADAFRRFHGDAVNLALHFVTSPLAVAAAFAAVNRALGKSLVTWVVCAAYLVHLASVVPALVFVGTQACTLAVAIFAERLQAAPFLLLAVVFALGYFGQDVAHLATGEETFQSSYQQDGDFWAQLAEHTYYLLPLLVDATIGADAEARRDAPLVDLPEGNVAMLAAGAAVFTMMGWTLLDSAWKKRKAGSAAAPPGGVKAKAA